MGRFDVLTQLEKKPVQSPALPEVPEDTFISENQFASKLADQQTSKEERQKDSKPTNQQTTKTENQFASKEVNRRISKPAQQQTTKEKKKYGTYLSEESISAIQIRAIQTKQKDHEVLQEIVDAYFAGKK